VNAAAAPDAGRPVPAAASRAARQRGGTADAPVLIAGAGPVGMACALLLARHGIASTVLEAAPQRPGAGSRSICTQRDVLDILDRIGCAAPMVAEGVTWTVGRTYYRDTEVATITFPEVGRSAYPPFINIPQTSVERYLEQRLLAEPLVRLHRGTPVTALAQDGSGVQVTAGGRTWLAGWLVACDGAHSSVRRLLGLPFPGESFADQFLICDIRADLPFPAERRFYFDPPWNPGRQVLVHPQPGGVWRIDWQVPADFDLAAERAGGALDSRIRAITGEVPYREVWASQYRFSQRIVPAYRVGRCLLAGDAAHVMAPFGARGLNSGFADAENAAWKLAHLLHGWAPESLLASYHDERHAAGLANLRVTGTTMRFLVPATGADRAHRLRVLRAALTDPGARAQIDSGRLAEPFCYDTSPLTTPAEATGTAPAVAGGAPGALDAPDAPGGPRPGQLAPDGPCLVPGEPAVRRLRQAFGRQWTVLTAAPQPPRLRTAGADVCVRRITRPGAPAGPGDVVDTDGVLGRVYGGATWLVRPDGHLAAVLPAGGATGAVASRLVTALRRASSGPTG
jgi:2-polyprenyl-6-methoxyphenol hydroxylase-like FAD-dependent oxidoreductase